MVKLRDDKSWVTRCRRGHVKSGPGDEDELVRNTA